MTYSSTTTRSTTTTTTEARVRYVMGKVMSNFNALVAAGLLSRERADKWHEDLVAVQMIDALASFQVQFAMGSSAPYCLNYEISSDGSVQMDATSGGLNVYDIPKNTSTTLCVGLHPGKYAVGREELERRGWTFNGKLMAATGSESRSFSSGGYGITRSKLGTWP